MGTGVYILPLCNPFVSARSAATIQLLSKARLLFGVGSGWLEEEFSAVGERFSNRGGRSEEVIEVMRRLWTGEPVTFSGQYVGFEGVQLSPPVSPSIPIVVGGMTTLAARRAARIGDG
jgi:alkanesulfonate monooxygenase SsuD/methylene tetrahydromethanopterin reductase-like flavin-dependent oxidoreductase (luciferase family)